MICELLDTPEFSYSVISPIFVIPSLGVWLRRIGIPGEAVIEGGCAATQW